MGGCLPECWPYRSPGSQPLAWFLMSRLMPPPGGMPRNSLTFVCIFRIKSDFSPFCCEFVQIPPFTPSLAQNTSKTQFLLKFFPVASEFRQNCPDAKFAILKIREVVLLIKNAKGKRAPFSKALRKPTVPTPLLVKDPLSPNCV